MGITIELCSGFIDKGETPQDGAVRELHEETGYCVNKNRLESVRTSVSPTGTTNHLFYLEVSEKDKVSNSYGLDHEGEDIELFYVPISNPGEMIQKLGDRASNIAYMSIYWFFHEKNSKITFK
ncbi:Uridine diphosphate glucose pyrophosphatase [Thelohanellus kitauei]|uniref:Uridine diphosphate glucose pyrophosphatase n=1 Tax=Thelohanellus kitauei TaxID=669202 RepID=A0A0C2MSI7_THEKT|nr:Uridine diphosphate glucose pyrophosphatase [Thelohanellus kitauei]